MINKCVQYFTLNLVHLVFIYGTVLAPKKDANEEKYILKENFQKIVTNLIIYKIVKFIRNETCVVSLCFLCILLLPLICI